MRIETSAGTVLCGADILTSNDPNECGCTNYTGLNLAPYNFNAHYPSVDGDESQARDARLQAFAAVQDRPVLALGDGAYVRVVNDQVEVVRGTVWRLDGQHKEFFQ